MHARVTISFIHPKVIGVNINMHNSVHVHSLLPGSCPVIVKLVKPSISEINHQPWPPEPRTELEQSKGLNSRTWE